MEDVADTLRYKDPDVTLVYSDGVEGVHFSGSRILLSASSPLLYALLKDQPFIPSTVVVTGSGGKNSTNFNSIMSFVHTGTIIVSKDDLEEVIAIASQLQLNCFSDLKENLESEQIVTEPWKKGDKNAPYLGAVVPQYSAYPPQVSGVSGGAEGDHGGDGDLDGDCCDGGMLGGQADGYGGMLGMGEPPSEYPRQSTQEITAINFEAVDEDSSMDSKKNL